MTEVYLIVNLEFDLPSGIVIDRLIQWEKCEIDIADFMAMCKAYEVEGVTIHEE